MEKPGDNYTKNRLANETSPYLQQHQYNPVDWYPWAEEAFEKARSENKPIFLSVGYSTCYWCHVMERESFENAEVAAVMNAHYVNIKVDREERPDVDQLYMTAVQVMTRQGGWPMSVWLTPQLRPFFGGTYFPREDAGDRPGFINACESLAEAFKNHRPDVEATADRLTEVLEELARPAAVEQILTLNHQWLQEHIAGSMRDYDSRNGGFGRAPKFPRQTLLELLLRWMSQQRNSLNEPGSTAGNTTGGTRLIDGDATALRGVESAVRHTLDAMANGGIRDHLGGGFHRYSTDERWLVPHFEIMLYDNAMLGWIYSEASRSLNEPRYEQIARGIFDFILREMTADGGAFYTAIDAEVDAHEGQNYLWTVAELEAVLSPRDAARFAHVYGLDRGPNFRDPHQPEAEPKNVLYLPAGANEENDESIVAMRQKLYEHRQTRKQPGVDDKIITSWCALMIRALAHGGKIFDEPRYLTAAKRAADFLLTQHVSADGRIARTSRDGNIALSNRNGYIARSNRDAQPRHAGLIDDYAFFAEALLDLADATDEQNYRQSAEAVVATMRTRFEDAQHGGFYFSDNTAAELLVRQKIGSDSPLPAGNAVAASVCDRVGQTESARAAIGLFATQADHHADSMSAHISAILQYITNHGDLRIEPGPATADGPVDRVVTLPQDAAVAAVRILEPEWTTPTHGTIRLSIAAGHHIDLLTLVGPEDNFERVDLPPTTRRRVGTSTEQLSVIEGDVALQFHLTEPPKPGSELVVSLKYQVCRDDACLPIVTRPIRIMVPETLP